MPYIEGTHNKKIVFKNMYITEDYRGFSKFQNSIFIIGKYGFHLFLWQLVVLMWNYHDIWSKKTILNRIFTTKTSINKDLFTICLKLL